MDRKKKEKSELESLLEDNKRLLEECKLREAIDENRRLKLRLKGIGVIFEQDDSYYTTRGFIKKSQIDKSDF